jgi:predicted nucleic acid-binding protein
MIAVLDASVAIKWFAPDREAGDVAAVRVLREVVAHPTRFAVPELFFYEMLAVLCRRMRQATDARAAYARLARLGLRRVRLDDRLVQRATRLAYERRLGGYDACYAALAAEVRGVWLTFDRAAHARLTGMGISHIPE